MNRNIMLFLAFVLNYALIPLSLAAELSQEEIDAYNQKSPVKIVNTFDPDKIENLVVGDKLVEWLTHFFGGYVYMGENFRKEYVTHYGEKLDERELRFGGREKNKIPFIFFDNHGKPTFSFSKYTPKNPSQNDQPFAELTTSNWNDALAFQNRKQESVYEQDPEKTIFLDTDDYSTITGQKDFINLKGSIFDLSELPREMKFKRILIEYLGDYLYDSKNGTRLLENMDWSWLAHLKNFLAKDGVIYFEIRNDKTTQQFGERKIEPPLIPAHLKRSYNQIKGESQIYSEDYLKDLVTNNLADYPKLKLEDLPLIFDNIYPKYETVGNPVSVASVVIKKFTDAGYKAQIEKDARIPNRIYKTIVIKAVPK